MPEMTTGSDVRRGMLPIICLRDRARLLAHRRSALRRIDRLLPLVLSLRAGKPRPGHRARPRAWAERRALHALRPASFDLRAHADARLDGADDLATARTQHLCLDRERHVRRGLSV